MKMKKTDLALAIHCATLALTKLAAVTQDLNDDLIVEGNQAAVTELPTQPIVDLSGDEPIAKEQLGELDDEGRPWVSGIHAATRGKCNSTEVKGGKKWRLFKGLDKAIGEKFYADHPLNPQGGSVGELEETKPALPSSPALPGVVANKPAGPASPASPSGPSLPAKVADPYTAIRNEIIIVCKNLIDDYELDWDDLKEVFVEEFKAEQNGEQVVFGSLKTSEYPRLKTFMLTLLADFQATDEAVKEIYNLAGAEHKEFVDTTVIEQLKPYNTEVVAGVHYSQISQFKQVMVDWLAAWKS